MNAKEVMAIKEYYEDELLEIEGVEGVALGEVDGELGVLVYSSDAIDSIPSTLEGVAVGIEGSVKVKEIRSGPFFSNGCPEHPALANLPAFALSSSFQSRIRPVPGGYSIGHDQQVMAGSSGCVFAIRKKDKSLLPILFSNAHVLIHNNNAPPWWRTLQPGRLDGGNPATDGVGELLLGWQLSKTTDNNVDCAISEAIPLNSFSGRYPDKGVLRFIWSWFNYGGTGCFKVGRTTGRVTGKVEGWFGTQVVDYGSYGGLGKIRFKHVTTVVSGHPISLPGDSGSVWVQPVDSGEWGYAGMNYAGPADGKRSISFPLGIIHNYFKSRNIPLLIYDQQPAVARPEFELGTLDVDASVDATPVMSEVGRNRLIERLD